MNRALIVFAILFSNVLFVANGFTNTFDLANPRQLPSSFNLDDLIDSTPISTDPWMISSKPDGLYRSRPDGSELSKISAPLGSEETIEEYLITPDRKYVVYVKGNYETAARNCEIDFCESAYRDILVVNIDVGVARVLSMGLPALERSPESLTGATFAISPNSTTVYVSSSFGRLYAVSIETGVITSQLETSVTLNGTPERIVLVTLANKKLSYLELDTGVLTTLTELTMTGARISRHIISDDLNWANFYADYDGDGMFSLYRVNLNDTVVTRISTEIGGRFGVSFHKLTNDSGLFYSVVNEDPIKRDLYFIGTALTEPSLLNTYRVSFGNILISRVSVIDGHLVAVNDDAGLAELYVYSMVGGLKVKIELPDLVGPTRVLIKIGDLGVLYKLTNSGQDRLYFNAFDGAPLNLLTAESILFSHRIEGSLFFRSSVSDNLNVMHKVSIDNGEIRSLFESDDSWKVSLALISGNNVFFEAEILQGSKKGDTEYYQFDLNEAVTEKVIFISQNPQDICFPILTKIEKVASVCL